jgi:hypothetical protein
MKPKRQTTMQIDPGEGTNRTAQPTGGSALTTPPLDGKNSERLILGGLLDQTFLGSKETSSELEETVA